MRLWRLWRTRLDFLCWQKRRVLISLDFILLTSCRPSVCLFSCLTEHIILFWIEDLFLASSGIIYSRLEWFLPVWRWMIHSRLNHLNLSDAIYPNSGTNQEWFVPSWNDNRPHFFAEEYVNIYWILQSIILTNALKTKFTACMFVNLPLEH